MDQPKHHFTPTEANRTLPLVRRIVGEIVAKGRHLAEFSGVEVGTPEHRQAVALMAELEALMAELHEIGCSYKDWSFSLGLVDFPSTIDGQDVLLCWRSDEPGVQYYHLPDAGFAGRRPIPAEMLAEADA